MAGERSGYNELGEEPSGLIIHEVAPTASHSHSWTHIEDLDSFFTRMYRYYLKGGFLAMLVSDCLQLLQYCFVVFFITFLVHCVDYPLLFRNRHTLDFADHNVTFSDLVYSNCSNRISTRWWLLIFACSLVGLFKLIRCAYHLYHAYDIKRFYNDALHIDDSDIGWLSWTSVQNKIREAQTVLQMCIHKQQITELDIYHRILRFDNYMVAMVNKRLLPLHIPVPFVGDIPYLSKGLKYNLDLLLFYGPWSPWENCWHLRDCYKDASKRLILAKQLQNHITCLTLLNTVLSPIILTWQFLYFFFSYVEIIKRSPEALGLRTWSLYSRNLLRHFNELDHELSDRLGRAHKPATKYLTSFPSPVVTLIAKNVTFLSGSFLSVIVVLSMYDESVLSVENMLALITLLGCTLATAKTFIPDQESKQRSSEELLVQVLGHVHYLPASWKGRAHTKQVAAHFQQLFQFRGMYILMELVSPIVTPFIIFSLRSRALDIVDFYRNFTVSVLDIGDVCSFAQMDVRRHGHPDWCAKKTPTEAPHSTNQYNQGEDGKTELSLVAFSCRNPAWRAPQVTQKNYLLTLQNSLTNATNTYHNVNPFAYQNNLYKTMLGSYYNQNLPSIGNQLTMPRSSIYLNQSRLNEEDEEGCREQENVATSTSDLRANRNQIVPDKVPSLAQEEQDMSVSTLHLYDLHLARLGERSTRQSSSQMDDLSHTSETRRINPRRSTSTNEDTPLLKKMNP